MIEASKSYDDSNTTPLTPIYSSITNETRITYLVLSIQTDNDVSNVGKSHSEVKVPQSIRIQVQTAL